MKLGRKAEMFDYKYSKHESYSVLHFECKFEANEKKAEKKNDGKI